MAKERVAWQAQHREHREVRREAVGAKGRGRAGRRKNLPRMSMASVKQFLPEAKGCYVWYERQTDRTRVKYRTSAGESSWSWPVADDLPKSIKLCVEWAWRQHKKAFAEAEAPWKIEGI